MSELTIVTVELLASIADRRESIFFMSLALSGLTSLQ